MFGRSILAVGAAMLPAALAQFSCSGTAGSPGGYSNITGFSAPRSCVPIGYFSAQDLGQIGPADLQTVCQNQCNSYGIVCQAFVGQNWFAADSGLSTGQCFYYTTPPTGARYCVDGPGAIVGQTKGGPAQPNPLVSCLSASPASASAFCSAFVTAAPSGSGTTITVTNTPVVTITSATTTASGTTTFITAALTTTTTTVTTTTTIPATTTTAATTSTTLEASTTITITPDLTSTGTTTTASGGPAKRSALPIRIPLNRRSNIVGRSLKARQNAILPPACFPGGSQADVSAACSCIGVVSGTAPVPVTSTFTSFASASTSTVLTATSIPDASTTATQTGTITSFTTSVTAFTTGTLTSTTTTTVTVTGSAVAFPACQACYTCSATSDCRDGFDCYQYPQEFYSFGTVNLCSNNDVNGVDYECASICTQSTVLQTRTPSATATP